MMKLAAKAKACLLLVTLLFSVVGTTLAADDPIIIPFKRFGLQWDTDLPEQIDLLRIWYSLDNGATWELYSETENPSSPAPVKVTEDGRYGFYTQARDVSGLEEKPPVPGTPPKIIAIIDTLKPALVLVTPNSSETFSNTQDLRIQWNASDLNFGPTPLSLYESRDGGGSWTVIKKDLPNTGTYIWKLPSESSEYYRVKVIATDLAGNEAEDISDTNFRVDGKAPVTRVTGPKEAKSPIFDVTYSASDLGGAGLAKVQIYYQIDGDKTWRLYGEDKDMKSPFRFEAKRGGRYGFKLVGTDRVGNSEPTPDASTRPDIWCLMDSVKPQVALLNFKGAIKPAGGGRTREIKWKAVDDNIAQSPITIELSSNDGATWDKIIVTDFNNTGSFPWRVPSNLNVAKARLRVTALDVLGNKGVDVSDAFAIDGKAPTTKVTIVTWNDDQASHQQGQITPKIKISKGPTAAPAKTADELVTDALRALETGDNYTAEELANKAVNTDPNNYKVHAAFGKIYFDKQDFGKSQKAYARSIELNSSYQSSRIGLAMTFYEMGRDILGKNVEKGKELFNKSAAQYEASIQIKPDVYDEYFNLGYILARLGKYDDALGYLGKATTLTKENGDAFWFIGQVYEKLEDQARALENYKLASKSYAAGTTGRQKADDKVKMLSQ
jgi:Tfp pilus assembly protein PilF